MKQCASDCIKGEVVSGSEPREYVVLSDWDLSKRANAGLYRNAEEVSGALPQ